MIFRFKHSFKQQLCVLRPELYKIAWSWCHNTALADDLVQEACVKALKNRAQLKDTSKLKPWLTRILYNLHIDYLRAKREQIPYDEEFQTDSNDNNDQASLIIREQNIQRVRDAIARLNDEHRKIITLVDLAGFSYTEVADVLDIPVGTVMSRLNRARNQLKSWLKMDGQSLKTHASLTTTNKSKPAANVFLRRVK